MTFFRKSISDGDLLEGILMEGAQRRHFENLLYTKYSYLIRDGIRKHQLSEDDCSMVYSDTILSIINNIQAGKFEGRSEFKTYVYQIFTNKCVDLLRKNATNKQKVNLGSSIEDYINILPDESRGVIEHLIEQYDTDLLRKRIYELGEKCTKMLLAWAEGFMDQEIAAQLGYQTAAVVKTSRLRCMERLRTLYKTGA